MPYVLRLHRARLSPSKACPVALEGLFVGGCTGLLLRALQQRGDVEDIVLVGCTGQFRLDSAQQRQHRLGRVMEIFSDFFLRDHIIWVRKRVEATQEVEGFTARGLGGSILYSLYQLAGWGTDTVKQHRLLLPVGQLLGEVTQTECLQLVLDGGEDVLSDTLTAFEPTESFHRYSMDTVCALDGSQQFVPVSDAALWLDCSAHSGGFTFLVGWVTPTPPTSVKPGGGHAG